MLTRRQFMLLLAGFVTLQAGPAFAKDGDDDDGGGGGGGHGGDDDDDDDDDDDGGHGGGGDDDDGGDDDGGNGGGDRGKKRDANRARDAVKKKKAATLREVLRLVRNKYPGRVIKVDVSGGSSSLLYTIKLIDDRNRRLQVRVDASQRRIVGAEFI